LGPRFPENAGFDYDVAHLTALPLDRYSVQAASPEIRVSWHDVTLWFVPDERHSEILVREGMSRGRVWTAYELSRVVPAANSADVRVIAVTKVIVVGDVVEVSSRRAERGRVREERKAQDPVGSGTSE